MHFLTFIFTVNHTNLQRANGLFDAMYHHFVASMPTSPHELIGHIMSMTGLNNTDGILTYTAGDVVIQGDEAIDTAMRRKQRALYALQMLLYVNGVMNYDGTFRGGNEVAEKWAQISGSCLTIRKILNAYSSMCVFQKRDLLSIALTGGKCQVHDITRLEICDPKKLNRFQRLVTTMLREARRELGGLRKQDGILFRPKLVPRQERVRDAMGNVECAHAGCTGHRTEAGMRADHVFKPKLRHVDDGCVFSTHAYVPIDEPPDYPYTGASKYRSPDIGTFIRVHTDKGRSTL